MHTPITFLNIAFDDMTPSEATALIVDLAMSGEGGQLSFANAQTIVTANADPRLAAALANSDLVLADGSGVRWGSRLSGTSIVHNLNGTDLIPDVCRHGASLGLSVYLLGAEPGVAETAAANLAKANPGLKIAGTQHGYFNESQTDEIIADISLAAPHLLLVAMGVPKQELWVDANCHRLPGVTCVGVGGLFDFVAERQPRAPKVFRQTGFEWVWRILMEPRRLFKRYAVSNTAFLGLVVTDRARSTISSRR